MYALTSPFFRRVPVCFFTLVTATFFGPAAMLASRWAAGKHCDRNKLYAN